MTLQEQITLTFWRPTTEKGLFLAPVWFFVVEPRLASMSSPLWDEGRRRTPNRDTLVPRQREKRDGKTRRCLFHFCLEMAPVTVVYISWPNKSQGQACHAAQPSVRWESTIFPQDGGWVGRNSQCFYNNIIYHKGNGKQLEKCLPFRNDRRRRPITKSSPSISKVLYAVLIIFHTLSHCILTSIPVQYWDLPKAPAAPEPELQVW